MQKNFADVVKVTDPKIGRLSRWVQSNHLKKELFSGRGQRVEADGEVKGVRSMRRTQNSIAGIEEEGNEPGNEGDF